MYPLSLRSPMAKYAESLEYEDKDYREHEKGKYNHYSDFTYSTYYITVEDYLTYLELGKKNDAGKMEYSAEDELKALAEADKDVATLPRQRQQGTAHRYSPDPMGLPGAGGDGLGRAERPGGGL